MSRIDEMIQRLCPDGVEYRKLGDLVNILDSRRKPIKKEDRTFGDYPYYGANGIQGLIDHYLFDGVHLLVGEDGSVTTPDGKPVLNWAVGKIWVNNHAHVLGERPEVASLRFLYHALSYTKVSDYVHGTPPKLNQKNLREIGIPVPSLDIQREIVRVLDSFAELEAGLEAELEAELEARKAQYAHYRDELLSRESLETMAGGEVSMVKVEELLDFKNGINKSKEFFGRGVPIVNYVDVYKRNSFNSGSLKGRVDADASEQARYDVKRGDVFFTRTSETQEEVGIAAVALEGIPGGVFSGFVLRGRPRGGSLLPEYCKYCFSSSSVRSQIIRYSSLTTRALTNGKSLSKVVIPVPPLSVQQQVVDILDRFDALTTLLADGLSAEIEARRQQYEHYRDRLLDFPRKEVA